MKLGKMQGPKPYKFLQEQVFDGVWPLNKFKSPLNVGLLTVLYFLWGLAIFIIYSIPPYFFISGIMAALSISVWTLGIFRYARTLRETQIEKLNSVNRKFLVQYLDALFHPSSIVIGVIIYIVTLVSLLAPHSLIVTLQEELQLTSLPPFILLYVFLVSWDICYRIGLSTYVMFTQIRRNIWLGRIIHNAKLKENFLPNNIKVLEEADKYHYLALGGGIFLFPFLILDPVLILGLYLYLTVAFISATVNLLQLRILHAKAIPENVIRLLASTRFAYVGTRSKNRMPHVTPTLFVFDGRNVFFATSIKSAKVRHLRRNPRVAVCIERRDKKELAKSQGVLIQGRARVYGHDLFTAVLYVMVFGVRLLLIRRLFYKKYPEYLKQYEEQRRFLPSAWRTRPILSRTVVEVLPSRVIWWKGTKYTQIAF
ncbi:MAG: pyridoxamine 5'-phosphate oxidase family protein [Candidatus Heimdallarchaeota archaeon]